MSVYFITCRDNGTVKIGCAQNPKARFKTLQVATPATLKLEATVFGSYETEAALHLRFAKQRVRGEWFTINDEIETLISAAAVAPGLPQQEAGRTLRAVADEELVERSLATNRELLAEHNRVFASAKFPTVTDLPIHPKFFVPVSAGGGQFGDRYCIRDGDGRLLCGDMGLTWDDADRLCAVLEGVRLRALALDLNLTRQTENRA